MIHCFGEQCDCIHHTDCSGKVGSLYLTNNSGAIAAPQWDILKMFSEFGLAQE
jgi:hypothetical protein